ncbi:MAG: TRAP transporter small permease [Alphaproteobacteria bacterium]
MNTIMRAVDAISNFAARLAGWIFFFIGLSITYEVVARYVFIAPTIWVDEISRILQVWAAYLGCAYALKNHDMIVIEIAFKDPGTLRRKLVETLAIVMLMIFAGTAVWFGFEIWLKSTLAGHTTDSFLAPPKWFTQSSIWIGFGLLMAQGLVQLYRLWTVGLPARADDPMAGME